MMHIVCTVEFRDSMIKRGHRKDCRYCCLASNYGNFKAYDCNANLIFSCAGNGKYSYIVLNEHFVFREYDLNKQYNL